MEIGSLVHSKILFFFNNEIFNEPRNILQQLVVEDLPLTAMSTTPLWSGVADDIILSSTLKDEVDRFVVAGDPSSNLALWVSKNCCTIP